MARSLTVILLLLQSTTHCRYRVHTKFLLTYTAIYRGNRKVLPLGITALQPQSHFHLGTSYTYIHYIHRHIRRYIHTHTHKPYAYPCFYTKAHKIIYCDVKITNWSVGTSRLKIFAFKAHSDFFSCIPSHAATKLSVM